MNSAVKWLELIFESVPLQFMEIWGRFAYLLGFALMIGAYSGITFRSDGRWGLGRERQVWNTKALFSLVLTFVLIFATGYLGSFIVLVPGAQTFESLKDLSVFLCIVLFGYPALIIVPIAYGLSDLIEGVPPGFLVDWIFGYFINPACFWVAYQLIGKNPDFRSARTWGWYLLFVVIFMSIEPQLWGYICSDKFTSAISYRNITPALFFTTSITWIIAPFAMLLALPLARKYGLFWAEIPGHVKERLFGHKEWTTLERNKTDLPTESAITQRGLPIQILIVSSFVVLVLVMVGASAYFSLRSAESDANKLARRLHQEISENINLQLDDYLDKSQKLDQTLRTEGIGKLLAELSIARHGRAFIIDQSGQLIASSWHDDKKRAGADAVINDAVQELQNRLGKLNSLSEEMQFRFDVITAKPLSRETWLTLATPYADKHGGHADWILLTAMPEGYYLEGVRTGNTQSAMVSAVALLCALIIASLLAAMVTAPIRRLAQATSALAKGDLTQRVPRSRTDELDALSQSFNHMAEQLSKYTERLQLATSAASLGIWDWDVVNNKLVWDDTMYQQYGIRREDFSGAYEAWVQALAPEDLNRAKADVEAALKGEREFASEFTIIWPDGSRRIIKGSGRTIRNETGRPLRMVGVNYDITERKLAEQELILHRDNLEKLVTERTAALSVAAAEAEQATQAKSNFLANMSHEIRTPMNAILGMTDLALRTELTAKQKDYLSKTKVAAMSLLGIINDILDFSKVEAGKLEMESEEFLLEEVLDKVTTIIGHKTYEKGLDFLLNTAKDVPQSLVGDPLRLGQILINLCNNAVKFTENGEIVVVTVKTIAASRDQVTLRFSIRDTGIGMDEEQVKLLFQPFSQVDSSATRKYAGTGLGLAISKQLVTLMGGEIGVKSQPGKGSDFYFTATFGIGAKLSGPALEPQPQLRQLRILVVDDSDNAREIFDGLLSSFGYQAVLLASANEGLTALLQAANAQQPFDLVLMDWKMPEMDGFTAARQIRQHPALLTRQPKIIMVTAFGKDDVEQQVVQERLDGYLSKPVSASSLFDAIATTCGTQCSTPALEQLQVEHSAELKNVLSSIEGLRVLLVEDNDFNQQIAYELLTGVAKMAVTIAPDGKAAIEHVRTGDFDLVLMDIQMPVMNGHEATRFIRGELGKHALPIIAMTANAMTKDREQCLASGMNDYVTKPFNPNELFKVMAKWAPSRAGNINAAPGTSHPRLHSTAAIISTETGLERCFGNRELYSRLLHTFAQQNAAITEAIRDKLQRGDMHDALLLAHSIKSNAGTIGAIELPDAALALEQAIAKNEVEHMEALLLNFEQQLLALLKELQNLI